jgi:cellulose synthase/poly-beta-1,6-N-acetylglucosamine synthase-like glycosyltransferase
MGYALLLIFDWLLWTVLAASTLYILFFALASLLPEKKSSRTTKQPNNQTAKQPTTFLVLFPAYKEDNVIIDSVRSVLTQAYPKDHFHVCVISDHMQPATNQQLASLPITLLQPKFEESSKAKALQFAMANNSLTSQLSPHNSSYIVILDADNVVAPDFLTLLDEECRSGHLAIQCHRTAKNDIGSIAALDGVSEEINNSIFRRGHSRLGLSAGLIGSGMCFDYKLFAEDVKQLSSAVEDRELEALLAHQRVHVHYAEHIMVYDEKVSSAENFQRQRMRWMTGQVQTLFTMVPHLPSALLHGNVNYVDKTIQQALIPRSLLLLFTFPVTILLTIAFILFGDCSMFNIQCSMIRWWCLFGALCMAIFIAIPGRLRLRALRHTLHVPHMAWLMCKNLFLMKVSSKEFLHTTHDGGNKE